MPTDIADELVPDKQVRRELGGISEMTMWRWDHDPKMAELGWPPPVYIRKRKYRSRRGLNAHRDACVSRAIAQRNQAVERIAQRDKAGEQPKATANP